MLVHWYLMYSLESKIKYIFLCYYWKHYKLTRLVEPEMADKKYKLIIVGHSNVGKSSIVKRYCKDIYQFTKPTIGTSIVLKPKQIIEQLYDNW